VLLAGFRPFASYIVVETKPSHDLSLQGWPDDHYAGPFRSDFNRFGFPGQTIARFELATPRRGRLPPFEQQMSRAGMAATQLGRPELCFRGLDGEIGRPRIIRTASARAGQSIR